MCYFYRHPPKGSGVQPVKKWAQIARLVWNADGKTHPTPNAVKYCVRNWKQVNKKRGRKNGWRKTTKQEDKKILASFQKARQPLGSDVSARDVATGLPAKLKRKVSFRTIRRRLAERGYVPERKLEKNDFLKAQCEIRVDFCKDHEHRTRGGALGLMMAALPKRGSECSQTRGPGECARSRVGVYVFM